MLDERLEKAKKAYIKIAQKKWNEEGHLEIDDSAAVSMASEDAEGAYVQAWIWVENPECADCGETVGIPFFDDKDPTKCLCAQCHEEEERDAKG